jgi:transglutaminase-like putative cysteine protease
MLLEIRHITQYAYDEPVRESVMELHMQPRKFTGQGLVSFDLEIDPQALVFNYADSYGNAVHHFDVPAPHRRLSILARSVVQTYPSPALPERLTPAEWERLDSDAVKGDCWDFLNPHGLVVETPALRDFVQTQGLDALRRHDPLTALTKLNETLYRAFDYESGITEADSPIDHALLEGRGVCQDFAHIMIAICRRWGVPARYVSGYLYTDQASGDRSNPDATHAWVEAYLPSLRWVGFDPTNNVLTGERHLSVAIGRDYTDVPPSRGVYKGDAESQLSVGVSVRQANSAVGQPEFLRMGAPAIAAARRRATGIALMDQHHQQQQQ